MSTTFLPKFRRFLRITEGTAPPDDRISSILSGISFHWVMNMKKQWKTYLFWIGLSVGTGALAAFLTRSGVSLYNATAVKPSLSPPAILFPIVWTVLYVLMGIGAARIFLSEPGKTRSAGLNVFIAQLTVNFFWSLLFFNAQAYGFAFAWILLLWVLILAMILIFRRVDPIAAYLQIPYLLWVSFAAYLNWAVWQMNM